MQPAPRLGWLQWTGAGLAGAIVLGSFLVPLVRSFWVRAAASSPASAAEHGPHLAATVTRGGETSPVVSGQVVFPGDRIQLTYTSDRDVQLGVLHAARDEAGVWVPQAGGDAAATVSAKAGRDLPVGVPIDLDNRAGAERVFALFCETEQPLEPLRAALAKTQELRRPPGCQVDGLTLAKKLR